MLFWLWYASIYIHFLHMPLLLPLRSHPFHRFSSVAHPFCFFEGKNLWQIKKNIMENRRGRKWKIHKTLYVFFLNIFYRLFLHDFYSFLTRSFIKIERWKIYMFSKQFHHVSTEEYILVHCFPWFMYTDFPPYTLWEVNLDFLIMWLC